MNNLDISKAASSDMQNTDYNTDTDNYALSVAPLSTNGIGFGKETQYTNTLWTQHWGYFNEHPELKSAVLMKSIWDVGKGYDCDPETSVILNHITGMGKDTFLDVLFNMDVIRYVGRDSWAEVIREDNNPMGTLLNLKPLDPGSIRKIIDSKGMILRYEQFNKLGEKKETLHTFEPWEIFELRNNRLADQYHGISVIESLDKTLLADLESFMDIKKVMHRQALPLIIWKLKTDDPVKIDGFVKKLADVRSKTEELIIPDDENLVSWEVVQINPSQMLLSWRNDVTNRFYRALGMPLILFGSSNSTESGGKMEYFAHEQVFEHSQGYIERQVWQQLGLRINLIPPTSMADQLKTDESKDVGNLQTQPNDLTAGVGK